MNASLFQIIKPLERGSPKIIVAKDHSPYCGLVQGPHVIKKHYAVHPTA